jgi:toxin ParE1/3/4
VTIFWSADATADLRGLRRYIAQDAPGTAAVVVARLREAVEGLEQFPSRGRPGRQAGTRELVVPRTPYVVVYRVTDEAVQVLRILHGAQDWPTA